MACDIDPKEFIWRAGRNGLRGPAGLLMCAWIIVMGAVGVFFFPQTIILDWETPRRVRFARDEARHSSPEPPDPAFDRIQAYDSEEAPAAPTRTTTPRTALTSADSAGRVPNQTREESVRDAPAAVAPTGMSKADWSRAGNAARWASGAMAPAADKRQPPIQMAAAGPVSVFAPRNRLLGGRSFRAFSLNDLAMGPRFAPLRRKTSVVLPVFAIQETRATGLDAAYSIAPEAPVARAPNPAVSTLGGAAELQTTGKDSRSGGGGPGASSGGPPSLTGLRRLLLREADRLGREAAAPAVLQVQRIASGAQAMAGAGAEHLRRFAARADREPEYFTQAYPDDEIAGKLGEAAEHVDGDGGIRAALQAAQRRLGEAYGCLAALNAGKNEPAASPECHKTAFRALESHQLVVDRIEALRTAAARAADDAAVRLRERCSERSDGPVEAESGCEALARLNTARQALQSVLDEALADLGPGWKAADPKLTAPLPATLWRARGRLKEHRDQLQRAELPPHPASLHVRQGAIEAFTQANIAWLEWAGAHEDPAPAPDRRALRAATGLKALGQTLAKMRETAAAIDTLLQAGVK